MRTSPPTPGVRPRRVAVVGSGVAGLTAAHVLASRCHVTLYEADTRLGGHADTHEVQVGNRTVALDTGFIVHNDRTYPTLLRLFAELGVRTQPCDMSMSVRCDQSALEYAGSRGLPGLFPRPRNLADPAYLRMLGEVRTFHRQARQLLATPAGDGAQDETLAAFVDRGGFSGYFVAHFLEPLVAAVWSCDPSMALDYPARYLLTFLDHHGMLTVFGSPSWRTVVGGSARYVERVAARLDVVRTGHPVTDVRESAQDVRITDARGTSDLFDAVVVATHPHQALGMLAEPSARQRRVLSAMPYTTNTAQLHTDESVLPRSRAARSSWNYWRRPAGDPAAGVLVSYDLTRLQRVEGAGRRFIVTLGGQDRVDPARVVATMSYEHPLYTPGSVAAQRELPLLHTARVAFAGAYHGWGFHEDGARSGVQAAEHLGVRWEHVTTDLPVLEPAR